MRARKRPLQLELPTRPTWGGKRKGAGRPRSDRSGVPHRTRPEHKRRHPVHATLRVAPAIATLRTKSKLKVFKQVVREIHDHAEQPEMQVVHFSLQRDHVHLIVEAEDKRALRRGLSRLQIRLALRLNKLASRKGRVFGDRYHARALKTPKETRRALAYVLLNARKHGAMPSRRAWIDPCSSGQFFDGWSRECFVPDGFEDDRPSTRAARTWLLESGWQIYEPLISPDEVPSS